MMVSSEVSLLPIEMMHMSLVWQLNYWHLVRYSMYSIKLIEIERDHGLSFSLSLIRLIDQLREVFLLEPLRCSRSLMAKVSHDMDYMYYYHCLQVRVLLLLLLRYRTHLNNHLD